MVLNFKAAILIFKWRTEYNQKYLPVVDVYQKLITIYITLKAFHASFSFQKPSFKQNLKLLNSETQLKFTAS